jgi:hypothetical protein
VKALLLAVLVILCCPLLFSCLVLGFVLGVIADGLRDGIKIWLLFSCLVLGFVLGVIADGLRDGIKIWRHCLTSMRTSFRAEVRK